MAGAVEPQRQGVGPLRNTNPLSIVWFPASGLSQSVTRQHRRVTRYCTTRVQSAPVACQLLGVVVKMVPPVRLNTLT